MTDIEDKLILYNAAKQETSKYINIAFHKNGISIIPSRNNWTISWNLEIDITNPDYRELCKCESEYKFNGIVLFPFSEEEIFNTDRTISREFRAFLLKLMKRDYCNLDNMIIRTPISDIIFIDYRAINNDLIKIGYGSSKF